VALTDDLTAAWELDEASGNALDSHGGSTLTDNNTVGSGTGLLYGTVRDFEQASGEYFSRADGADISMGAGVSFTFEAWVNIESFDGTFNVVVGKDDQGSNREYCLFITSTLIDWYATNDGASVVECVKMEALSAGTWYQLLFGYDADADELFLRVNNGSATTTSFSTGVYDGSATFQVGARNGALNFDGRLGPLRLWKRLHTSDERTALYNGGAGLPYAEFGGSPPGEGSGTVSGIGVVTGAGATIRSGSGSVTGIGVVTGTGATVRTGSGSCSGVGTVTGAGTTVRTGAGTVIGIGVITGAGDAPTEAPAGAGSVVGVGVFTGSGSTTRTGAGSVSAVGLLTGAGTTVRSGAGTITGVGFLTGVGDDTDEDVALNVLSFTLPACRTISLTLPAVRTLEFDARGNPVVTGTPHVGDEGTAIVLEIPDETGAPIDVSDATEMLIRLKRPGSTTELLTAEHYTDGTDAKIKYPTLSTTFDRVGLYEVQGTVTVDGNEFSSDVGTFTVAKRL
jgi:hypothetical protein